MLGLKEHPHWPHVVKVCARLRDGGYRALLAGGCVRDGLLGRPIGDFDIATSAHPEQIESLFERTEPIGKDFGVILVVVEGCAFEVATFRTDLGYSDGRKPSAVNFSTAEEDVKRRDFTVNALLYDPIDDTIFDYVGGREDLQSRILRTVGAPELRFAEDHLRILRLIRFAAQLDFTIEGATWSAARSLSGHVGRLSVERIQQELDKLLGVPSWKGYELLLDSGLGSVLLPEFNLSSLERSDSNRNWSAYQKWLWILISQKINFNEFLNKWRFSKVTKRAFSRALRLFESLEMGHDLAQVLLESAKCDEETLHVFLSMESLIPRELTLSTWQHAVQCVASPLLTGGDALQMGIPPGPKVQKVLESSLKQQILKKLKTRDEALCWLKTEVSPG